MTDTTRGDVLAAPRANVFSREGYLFNPWIDFLGLGGLAIIICAIVVAVLPAGIPRTETGILILVLMTAINQPHFAHSYQIFYSNFREKAFGASYSRELRIRYIIAGIVVPVALIGFLALSVALSDTRMLSFGANLMFFLVGWHYVKQGYGILMLDSVQKKLFFSDQAKLLFRVNGYACWMVAWVMVNHAIAQAVPYIGITYYTFDLPTELYSVICAVAAVTTVATLLTFAAPAVATPALTLIARLPWNLIADRGALKTDVAQVREAAAKFRWREVGRGLPWNGVMAYLTTLYLWVVFVRINPLVMIIVPTFHSLQYMLVVWRYEINANKNRESAEKPAMLHDRVSRIVPARLMPSRLWFSIGVFTLFGVFLGFLGFYGLPRWFDSWVPYDKSIFGSALFLFCFYIFINVHHYFLDNVMWRRGNPDVRNNLFSRPK